MSGYSIFSNIKQSVSYLDAVCADSTLQAFVKKGTQIRYAARRDCQPVPNDPIRMDAFSEEFLNVYKLVDDPMLKWCDQRRNNLALAICALIDKNNIIDCATDLACPHNVPDHKKLWMPPDSKKVFRKCETETEDCCGTLIVWQQISGPFGTLPPEEPVDPVFKGASTEIPPEAACFWLQTDTDKALKKTSIGWVEI